ELGVRLQLGRRAERARDRVRAPIELIDQYVGRGEAGGFCRLRRHLLSPWVLYARGRPGQGTQGGGEEAEAVQRRAGQRLHRVFRVRHDADDVAGLTGDRGDVPQRTVRVAVDVARDDAAAGLELVQRAVVGDETALTVLDRDQHFLTRGERVGPG